MKQKISKQKSSQNLRDMEGAEPLATLRNIVGNKKVVAVIPAHNESKYIEQVVKDTKKYTDDVIVVDDASTDDTYNLAKKAGAKVLRHVINLQKGAALKTGCEGAIIMKADIIITLDADGQHDPHEIPKIISKLNKFDLIIGARNFNQDMPFTSKLGNKVLSKVSRILFRNKISDSQTGYRAFNTKIYPKISWESSSYGVESEMIKNIHKHNIEHAEVNIKTIYYNNVKGTTPLDGFKILINMIQWKFKQ